MSGLEDSLGLQVLASRSDASAGAGTAQPARRAVVFFGAQARDNAERLRTELTLATPSEILRTSLSALNGDGMMTDYGPSGPYSWFGAALSSSDPLVQLANEFMRAAFVFVDTDAATVRITGLAAPAEPRLALCRKYLLNVGGYDLNLEPSDEEGGFVMSDDSRVLAPNTGVRLVYDRVALRWLVSDPVATKDPPPPDLPMESELVAVQSMFSISALTAWSVNECIVAGYAGPLFRVRRASDNAEQDIGFLSNGIVDEAAIATFCGAAQGFVSVLYGQTTYAKHVTQGTLTKQYRIYTGAAVIKSGSVVCMEFGPGKELTRADAAGWSPEVTNNGGTFIVVGKLATIAGSGTGGGWIMRAGNTVDDGYHRFGLTAEPTGAVRSQGTYNFADYPGAETTKFHGIVVHGTGSNGLQGTALLQDDHPESIIAVAYNNGWQGIPPQVTNEAFFVGQADAGKAFLVSTLAMMTAHVTDSLGGHTQAQPEADRQTLLAWFAVRCVQGNP